MIQPLLKDDALLADIAQSKGHLVDFSLWWLGQSGFLIQWEGHHLLLDPYLSDSLTNKYAATDKPHVRMTELVIGPKRLNFLEAVTSSHNHTDHLDAETLLPLFTANPGLPLLLPEANINFASERLGTAMTNLLGINVGQPVTVGAFTFHAIPAAHETLQCDDQSRHKFMGYVIKFGPWTVYHSGDTLLFDGMVEALKPFAIDVALLPINGRAPERRVAGNLNGVEAAGLAKQIGAKTAIPCHYDMFEFNTSDPAEFVAAANKVSQPHVVLKAGERWCSADL